MYQLNRPPSAGDLFDCVATHDYNALVQVLAAEGLRILQSRCGAWEQGKEKRGALSSGCAASMCVARLCVETKTTSTTCGYR